MMASTPIIMTRAIRYDPDVEHTHTTSHITGLEDRLLYLEAMILKLAPVIAAIQVDGSLDFGSIGQLDDADYGAITSAASVFEDYGSITSGVTVTADYGVIVA